MSGRAKFQGDSQVFMEWTDKSRVTSNIPDCFSLFPARMILCPAANEYLAFQGPCRDNSTALRARVSNSYLALSLKLKG